MLYSSQNKNAVKASYRGAGALFVASLAGLNGAVIESVGNTTMDTIRYGASALILGGAAVASFLKFGRNFEATVPSSKELTAAKAPKRPQPSRGAGPLFVASSIFAAANGAAIETLSNVNADSLRNGATALVLGALAATSLVKSLKRPAYGFAYAGEPVAEFPSRTAESAPERFTPVIIDGAAKYTIPELFEQEAERAKARQLESLQAASRGTSHPIA